MGVGVGFMLGFRVRVRITARVTVRGLVRYCKWIFLLSQCSHKVHGQKIGFLARIEAQGEGLGQHCREADPKAEAGAHQARSGLLSEASSRHDSAEGVQEKDGGPSAVPPFRAAVCQGIG